jgi:hypothetical protein
VKVLLRSFLALTSCVQAVSDCDSFASICKFTSTLSNQITRSAVWEAFSDPSIASAAAVASRTVGRSETGIAAIPASPRNYLCLGCPRIWQFSKISFCSRLLVATHSAQKQIYFLEIFEGATDQNGQDITNIICSCRHAKGLTSVPFHNTQLEKGGSWYPYAGAFERSASR